MKREEYECFPTDTFWFALKGNNTKFGKMFPQMFGHKILSHVDKKLT